MKSMTPQAAAHLSETERLDAELDLLVDAELPEERRRTLLQQIAAGRDGWKMLAIRFLQRQVEWQAVGNLLHAPAAGSSRRPSALVKPQGYAKLGSTMKLAASIVLTAGLFGLGGAYLGRQTAMSAGAGEKTIAVRTPPGSQAPGPKVMVSAPGRRSLANGFPLPVGVPVVDGHKVPFDYPFAGFSGPAASGRVVIVPEGHNQAVAFPVQEVAAEKVY
ncbi:MAG: hypothetical protein HKL95_00560 [Phycisphaerae bacterium]|nr:hypothetical protein [Phycisphaerae bacterium]